MKKLGVYLGHKGITQSYVYLVLKAMLLVAEKSTGGPHEQTTTTSTSLLTETRGMF